jgi:hypothetical protein
MPRPSTTATSAVVAGKSGAQDGTVAKAKPALRPLHFIPPLLVALAHLYYLVSKREKVFNMFITSGGSTAAMTSWTEAFGFSIGYILVVVLAVKILKGKGTKTLTPEGKEVVSGPVIYDPREAMIVSIQPCQKRRSGRPSGRTYVDRVAGFRFTRSSR